MIFDLSGPSLTSALNLSLAFSREQGVGALKDLVSVISDEALQSVVIAYPHQFTVRLEQ